MYSVCVKAPTRLDLAGGTLDIWPIHHLLEKKATINIAIDLYAQTTLESLDSPTFVLSSEDQKITTQGDWSSVTQEKSPLPLISLLLEALWSPKLPGLKITTKARSPKGAGIGGSSSLGISVAAALWQARHKLTGSPLYTEEELVQTVRDVEAKLIHSPTGLQDYWAAVRGGLNLISYPFGRPHVETLPVSFQKPLQERLIVAYSGVSRQSAINNWEVFKHIFEKTGEVFTTMNELGQEAINCTRALKEKNWQEALTFSQKEWQKRCQLWPAVETPETKELAQIAYRQGGTFSRVSGAGGGGVMSFFCPPEKKEDIKKALSSHGAQILPTEICEKGLHFKEL